MQPSLSTAPPIICMDYTNETKLSHENQLVPYIQKKRQTNLDVEMPHPKRPPSCLPYHSKRLWSGQTHGESISTSDNNQPTQTLEGNGAAQQWW